MKRICPACEKETEIQKIRGRESIDVRNEKIEVDVIYFKCMECEVEFENTRGHDALELAYQEYRKRHGLLSPLYIKKWRTSHDLSQKELSQILDWEGDVLSRYENGALLSEVHEKQLRLVMQSRDL